MSACQLLTVQAAAQHLGATPNEVMEAATITLGELMHAAARAGLDPEMDYRRVPCIPEDILDELADRIALERAELAALDARDSIRDLHAPRS